VPRSSRRCNVQRLKRFPSSRHLSPPGPSPYI